MLAFGSLWQNVILNPVIFLGANLEECRFAGLGLKRPLLNDNWKVVGRVTVQEAVCWLMYDPRLA